MQNLIMNTRPANLNLIVTSRPSKGPMHDRKGGTPHTQGPLALAATTGPAASQAPSHLISASVSSLIKRGLETKRPPSP